MNFILLIHFTQAMLLYGVNTMKQLPLLHAYLHVAYILLSRLFILLNELDIKRQL